MNAMKIAATIALALSAIVAPSAETATAKEPKIRSINLVCCPGDVVEQMKKKAEPGTKVFFGCGGKLSAKSMRGVEVRQIYC
jgi:hypothetical protein